MDARLRLAVAASRAWYDDVFALNGLPTSCDGTLWRALTEPPPYHSAVKTLQPGVPASAVLAAVSGAGSVADSFADLELPGFTVLFDATWLHHAGRTPRGVPTGWSVLRTTEALDLWCRRHDYVGVLPDAVLERAAFAVLGWYDGAELVGGAVLHEGSRAVDLSNTWTLDGHPMDWDELIAAACALRPDRPLTGYARGKELDGLLGEGFQAVGAQRVWVPSQPERGSSSRR